MEEFKKQLIKHLGKDIKSFGEIKTKTIDGTEVLFMFNKIKKFYVQLVDQNKRCRIYITKDKKEKTDWDKVYSIEYSCYPDIKTSSNFLTDFKSIPEEHWDFLSNVVDKIYIDKYLYEKFKK